MLTRSSVAFALLLAVAGCSSYKQPPEAFHKALTAPYMLEASDRVRVIVYDQPDLSNSFNVSQNGTIAFPLIGSVMARGKTADQLAQTIKARLRKNYIKEPDVSVEVETYRPIFVMGEVSGAGQYTYLPGMTVQNAIATAGGFTPRAEQMDVDVTRQTRGDITSARVAITDPLKPGDTIYVRERFF